MNTTTLTLAALTATVTDGKASFGFLTGMWSTNRLAASALINRASGLIGTTRSAQNHSAKLYSDEFSYADGKLERALNTRRPRLPEELRPFVKNEPLHGIADYKRVYEAIDYVATYELHGWLMELQEKLEAGASPADIYNSVAQLGVELDGHCECLALGVFDKADLQEQWMHLHHGDYNHIIWTLLKEHGMIGKVRRVWNKESTWPADERTLSEDYHERFGSFLKGRPDEAWFQNPSPIATTAA